MVVGLLLHFHQMFENADKAGLRYSQFPLEKVHIVLKKQCVIMQY